MQTSFPSEEGAAPQNLAKAVSTKRVDEKVPRLTTNRGASSLKLDARSASNVSWAGGTGSSPITPHDKPVTPGARGSSESLGTGSTSRGKKSMIFNPLRSKQSVFFDDAAQLNTRFRTKEVLGHGGFGTVYKVEMISGTQKGPSGMIEPCAMKTIPIVGVEKSAGSKALFERELNISRRLNHPNICKLNEYSVDQTNYYLIMDLCTGGDLLEYINEPPPKFRGLLADVAARALWQMVSGMAYLHHYRLAHRDVKPENYMIKTRVEQGTQAYQNPVLMLIDFGLARSCRDDQQMMTICGTPQYSAPEVLKGTPYNLPCDLWSIGCVCITMVLADIPFPDAEEDEILASIASNKLQLNYDSEKFKAQPTELKSLIKALLEVEPSSRPTAKSLLVDNEWLKTHADFAKPPQTAKEILQAECCSLM